MKKLIVVSLVLLSLTGCISYSNDGDNRVTRTAGIDAGKTTESWLLSQLGKPDHRRTTSKGTEILHYRFDEKEKSKLSLLLLINISNVSHTTKDFYVELEDELVVDYWYD